MLVLVPDDAPDLVDRLRRAWPGVSLDPLPFAHRVAEARAGSSREVQVEELYLATACMAGDRAALAHFDRVYVSRIPQHVARFRLSAAELDDLQQVVRMRLLTGPRPKLASYSGVGALGAWVRVVAVRAALELRSAPRARMVELADDAPARLAPELETAGDRSMATLLDQSHRPIVRAALEEALLALSDRDRTVLRMHVVDQLGIDAIGVVYRVHRATVARWLSAIRDGVLDVVGRRLQLDLRLSRSSVASLVRAFDFEVQLSLSRILAAAGPR